MWFIIRWLNNKQAARAIEVEGVLVAPEPLQKIILELCQYKPGYGHMGMDKTTEGVKRYAMWYKMLGSCSVFCAGNYSPFDRFPGL